MCRYKKEVRTALEREEALQQAKAQAEVDWQRRCEDVERQQYERSEDLVRRLTKARDQVSVITRPTGHRPLLPVPLMAMLTSCQIIRELYHSEI